MPWIFFKYCKYLSIDTIQTQTYSRICLQNNWSPISQKNLQQQSEMLQSRLIIFSTNKIFGFYPKFQNESFLVAYSRRITLSNWNKQPSREYKYSSRCVWVAATDGNVDNRYNVDNERQFTISSHLIRLHILNHVYLLPNPIGRQNRPYRTCCISSTLKWSSCKTQFGPWINWKKKSATNNNQVNWNSNTMAKKISRSGLTPWLCFGSGSICRIPSSCLFVCQSISSCSICVGTSCRRRHCVSKRKWRAPVWCRLWTHSPFQSWCRRSSLQRGPAKYFDPTAILISWQHGQIYAILLIQSQQTNWTHSKFFDRFIKSVTNYRIHKNFQRIKWMFDLHDSVHAIQIFLVDIEPEDEHR